MALSPEVQASIVKTASDWALERAKLQWRRGTKKTFADLLEENFEWAYRYLLKVIEKNN